MTVVLPQNDARASARAETLREHRARYRYAYDWPPGVATGARLEVDDHYSAPYLAKTLEVSARLGVNLAAMTLDGDIDGAELARTLARRMDDVRRENLHEHHLKAPRHLTEAIPLRWPASWDTYKRLFATIDPPKVVSFFERGGRDQDLAFAWQRIAGVNPMVLARCTALPPHFPVDAARFAKLLGGSSLAAAAAEHRLYLADYAVLDGLEMGEYAGLRKYCAAPLALFAVEPSSKRLRPVAIQLGQTPGPATPMVYPDQGWAWRAAQLAVQIADANVHEGIVHLARTHLVMEAVRLGMERQLAPAHPLHKLLTPHLETTAAINHSAKTSLIAPGSTVDMCFAASIEAFCGVVKHALATYPIATSSPLADLAARGLDDADALPEHPYRDDVRLIARIVDDFVGEYLDLYYPLDADVAADYELQGFVNELGANDGGRLRGIPEVKTVAALKQLIARFVFIAGPGHSCVNFAQFPYMSYPPNLCGASFCPIPTGEVTEAQYTAMQPPYPIAIEGLTMIYVLSETRTTTFGDYGWLAFERQVTPVLERLRARLADAERVIDERDPGRLIPYPFLRPSQILQSISI